MTHSVVIAGATGMIGRLVLELCLAHPAVSAVTAVGRRPTGLWHDKLREVAHSDFSDCRPVADALLGHDVAHFCVGVYTGVVPDAELRRVTVDCAVGFAAALHSQSPQAAFCLLSGQGADRRERSRVAFARYKGMAENGILQLAAR